MHLVKDYVLVYDTISETMDSKNYEIYEKLVQNYFFLFTVETMDNFGKNVKKFSTWKTSPLMINELNHSFLNP